MISQGEACTARLCKWAWSHHHESYEHTWDRGCHRCCILCGKDAFTAIGGISSDFNPNEGLHNQSVKTCMRTAGHGSHWIATALSSSSADCAGLQSTATTCAAPRMQRLSALQPPLVSVRTTSSARMRSTCHRTKVRGHTPQLRLSQLWMGGEPSLLIINFLAFQNVKLILRHAYKACSHSCV